MPTMSALTLKLKGELITSNYDYTCFLAKYLRDLGTDGTVMCVMIRFVNRYMIKWTSSLLNIEKETEKEVPFRVEPAVHFMKIYLPT